MLNISQKLCTGCGSCYNRCPKRCISMQENEEGFLYPVVDIKRCINCNVCNEVCPLEKENNVQSDAYCVTSKNTVLKQSSSAGVASLILKEVISNGGIVFGAAFDKEYAVTHKKIDKIDDINRLAGSKYVQSNIGTTYIEVKNALDENKIVAYVGTPCQIAGLESFLGKNYENLYMIDFICHGVPSPKVWKHYLNYIKECNDLGDIKNVNFRDKEHGWANYGMRITGTKNEYFSLKNDDLYEKAFIRNITLRKSCYLCRFKGNNRHSDLTLGDFWGGKNLSSIFDSNGTSVVALHTQKGRNLFDMISNSINYDEINLSEYAWKYNRSMVCPVKPTRVREKFFKKFIKSPENIAVLLENHIKMTNLVYAMISYKSKAMWVINKIICMLKVSKSINKGA